MREKMPSELFLRWPPRTCLTLLKPGYTYACHEKQNRMKLYADKRWSCPTTFQVGSCVWVRNVREEDVRCASRAAIQRRHQGFQMSYRTALLCVHHPSFLSTLSSPLLICSSQPPTLKMGAQLVSVIGCHRSTFTLSCCRQVWPSLSMYTFGSTCVLITNSQYLLGVSMPAMPLLASLWT